MDLSNREIPLLPKATITPPNTAETLSGQDGRPARGGSIITWDKETGKEVRVQRRRQTKDEIKRVRRIRQIGACDDCRKAKIKCRHAHRLLEQEASEPESGLDGPEMQHNVGENLARTPLQTPEDPSIDLMDKFPIQEDLSRDVILDPRLLNPLPLTYAQALRVPYSRNPSLASSTHGSDQAAYSFSRELSTGSKAPEPLFPTVVPALLHGDIPSSEISPSPRRVSSVFGRSEYSELPQTSSHLEQNTESGFCSSSGNQNQSLVSPVQVDPDSPVHDYPSVAGESAFEMEGWISQDRNVSDREMPRRSLWDVANFEYPLASTSRSSSPGTFSSRRRNQYQLLFDDSDIKCTCCGAGFSKQTDLRHHMRSHRTYTDRPYVCGHCAKRFSYRKDLTRHEATHDTELPWACDECEYRAKRKDHLQRHILTKHGSSTLASSSRGY